MRSRSSDAALERAQRGIERYVRIRALIRRSEHVIAMAIEQMNQADAVLRRSAITLRDLKRAAMDPPSRRRPDPGASPASAARGRGGSEPESR